MPIKARNDTRGKYPVANVIEAIEYAVSNGANVINMSIGRNASKYRPPFTGIDYARYGEALQKAYDNGVTIVSSAGNNNWGGNVGWPSYYPTVISVGATDRNNARAPYSNYGDGLDLVAPGGYITGLDETGGVYQETVENGQLVYAFYQGSKFKCLHVVPAI